MCPTLKFMLGRLSLLALTIPSYALWVRSCLPLAMIPAVKRMAGRCV